MKIDGAQEATKEERELFERLAEVSEFDPAEQG